MEGKFLAEDDQYLENPRAGLSPEELYQKLVTRIKAYHPSGNLTTIEEAYRLAQKAHKGQLRKSGEPYMIHPLRVALILAELHLDKETIAAGLLHDVVEDTAYTLSDVREMFGGEVALLVDGVTKLSQVPKSMDSAERQSVNLQKILLAMAKDIRVIIIKLADRLHNMRTLEYQKPEKQKKIAGETLDIYSPLALRLGISKIERELDDRAFFYLHGKEYERMEALVRNSEENRQRFVLERMEEIKEVLGKEKLSFELAYHRKHLFSIYRKMLKGGWSMAGLYDVFSIHILTKSIRNCYTVLGCIHERYKPVPGCFKDYIAIPKANMYRSLHTTVVNDRGEKFEIQIKTYEMQTAADYGITSYWKYKEDRQGEVINEKNQLKLSWLQRILEWQQDTGDNKEFLDLLKDELDIFSDRINCFTPSGEIRSLPAKATPVDFAYSIHSEVGNNMKYALVGGERVEDSHCLKNGDQVRIVTEKGLGPKLEWLKDVKSTQAKNRIRQWFKEKATGERCRQGRKMLQSVYEEMGSDWREVTEEEKKKTAAFFGLSDFSVLLAAAAMGKIDVHRIWERLEKLQWRKRMEEESKTTPEERYHLSKCCSPVPGDPILGYHSKSRGWMIHREDCSQLAHLENRERLTRISWKDVEKNWQNFGTVVRIQVRNQVGVLGEISSVFARQNKRIESMDVKPHRAEAEIRIKFSVKDREDVERVIREISFLPDVIRVERE